MWNRIRHWFGIHTFGEWDEPKIWDLIRIRIDGTKRCHQGIVQERPCLICGARQNRVLKYID
jgi:hypothetical protein